MMRSFLSFLRDDRAQATTEYLLMLAFATLLAGLLKKYLGPLFLKLGDDLDKRINDLLFNPKTIRGKFPSP